MNGNNLVVDTNVFLYLLKGDEKAYDLLNKRVLYVSFVTELELLGDAKLAAEDEMLVRQMLNQCVILDVNQQIREEAIRLRKQHRLKIPDLLIAATSIYLDIPLVTADKAFLKLDTLNLIYYH